MKSALIIALAMILSASSHAMDQATIVISKVLEAPTSDTREMILKHKQTEETLYVDLNVQLSDKDFEDMKLIQGDDVSILIKLTEEGKQKFAKLTKESIGTRLAITANGRVLSAPVVREPILGGSLQISGNMTKDEAEEMIALFHKAKNG